MRGAANHEPRSRRPLVARLVAGCSYYRRMIPFVRSVARGEHRSVLTAGERVLAVAPRDALVLGTMASSAGALGQVDDARQLWLRALEAEPDDFSALSGLAASFVDEGDHVRAYPLVRRALKAAPVVGERVDGLGLRLNRWLGFVLRRPGLAQRYQREHVQRQEQLAGWIEWAHEYLEWCEAVFDETPQTVH